ncbi:hypothetical protein [Caldinitratiruptor microaerophilus]|uniref:Uncharacterized protein n=1 Tax=Caldinitratiruptor microaerophilus TaxID=671077 RepID=A0AA35G8G2_9FIRM|nr:hypothetical protein [Caldinitratiruptor microaerophilus]BDG59239.1 hypothetical protein caldi_03290 [Caldinitratiruptor microaerophilus]
MTVDSVKWGPASRGSPGSAGVTQVQVVPTSASVATFRPPGTVRSVSFEFQQVQAGPAAASQPAPGGMTQGVPPVSGGGLAAVPMSPLVPLADPLASLLLLGALTSPIAALAAAPLAFLDPAALMAMGAGVSPWVLGFDPSVLAGPLAMGLGLSLFM